MAIGFSERFDFRPIIGWELDQVKIDKYHVMFFFENEHALLNVADRFSFRSADNAVRYEYTIYGDQKSLNVDSILRVRVREIKIVSKDRLDLIFENGDVLSVYDNPEFCSWWFLGGSENLPGGGTSPYTFEISDMDEDCMTETEREERRKP